MHVTNARVADRALKVAEWSDGLQRQAAMCVVLAASTARRPWQARKALSVIPHPDLRAAAMLLLIDLAAARPGLGGNVALARSYQRTASVIRTAVAMVVNST